MSMLIAREKKIDEQEMRNLLQSGFKKVEPKIVEMSNLMMDMYQQGFMDCWKLLTGESFRDGSEGL